MRILLELVALYLSNKYNNSSVSPLWRGLGNIHGFVLDGLLLKPQLSSPPQCEDGANSMRITTVVYGRLSLVTNKDEVARRSF